MKHLLLALLLLVAGLFQQVKAQDRTISGRVTDRSSGEGLPGVTVLVKGTQVGGATNADGTFSLSAPAAATTLRVSSVGYTAVDQPITSGVMTISLLSDVKQLNEVVVSGLATNVKRSNLANSIATISAKELTGSTRQVTIDAALNGKIAGANISSNSGAPGGGVSVQLRGISTITGESQPLYVVDGVYVSNDQVGNGAGSSAFSGAATGAGSSLRTSQDGGINRISDLNPNDIESIEVLKGPSAAAIYGTRANAGVILIRTKRGVAGQTRVSLTQDIGYAAASRLIGVENWDDKKIDTFYAYPSDDPEDIAKVDKRRASEKAALAAAQTNGKVYDYEKEVYGNKGLLTSTGVTVSGGVEKTRFYVSASTTKENGIVKGTDFNRNSIRANLDQKVGKVLDLSISSNYINSSNRRGYFGNDNNGISVSYNLPYTPSYAELHKDPTTGLFPRTRYTPENPLAVLERSLNEESTNRFVQAATATVHIIESDNTSLRFAAQGGLDYASTNATIFLPSDLQSQRDQQNPGAIRLSRNNTFNTNLQGFLIYDWKLLDGNLNLTSQVGAVRLSNLSRLSFSQGVGLVPGPPTPEVAAIQTQNSFQRSSVDVGYVAQQEFNFRDQIIATAGIRFDKTSLNADVNKLYAFPKASLAVNIAKFGFWSVDQVNQLKLRAAYGETGGVPGFGATFFPLVGLATGGRNGYIQGTTVGNLSIAPETASELEAGLDVGLFQNKILLEASVYEKKVKNLINTRSLAPGTGVNSIGFFPVGDLRNRGLELGLTVTPVTSSNFVWNSTTQFWLNRTVVTRVADKVPDFNPGSSFGSIFGRTLFSLDESPSRWYATPRTKETKLGLTRYEEAQPTFTMSFLNSFTILKNFQASFLLVWKKDGYVSNLSRELADEGGTSPDWSGDSGYRDPADPNTVVPNGLGPRLYGTPGNNGRYFIQNAGFVRLREVSLYYTLPAAIRTSVFKDYVANIRVGVSGNNVFTWTKYVGYDPEVSNFGNVANGAGVDVTAYPSSRRLFFHLGIDF